MPWIVGIDEAGYGPNLGPFVMTAVACRVPAKHAAADLWNVFRSVARRYDDPVDKRFVVADSKQVFSQSRGLCCLEETVYATLNGGARATLGELIDHVCPECRDEVAREIWYTGVTPIPVEADQAMCSSAGQLLAGLCERSDIHWGVIHSQVVCPAAFNALLDQWGTKGSVLALSMIRLLRALPRDDESLFVVIDKHGGRNSYAALLQPAFDNGLVIAHVEGSEESTYHVEDAGRQVTVTIRPRADAGHFCVALASMVSKYLRELLMLEFNRFWLGKLPGLKPTAGYPSDAGRFWEDIRQTVQMLGVPDDTLWRRK